MQPTPSPAYASYGSHAPAAPPHQMLVGGENVYGSEVEAALAEHPAVAAAAAFGQPHPLLGEVVAAAVVLRPPAPAPPAAAAATAAPATAATAAGGAAGAGAATAGVTESELVAWCRQRLAHYKVPAKVRHMRSSAREAPARRPRHDVRLVMRQRPIHLVPCCAVIDMH